MEKDKKDVVDDSVIEDYSSYEDNLREEKLKEEKIKEKEESVKDARTISVIVAFIIILFGVGIYGFAYLSKEDNNSNKNNNLNSDYISDNDIPTFSDEEEINEEDFDGKVINIYQKGYADNGPIAFTYKCRSDQCDVKVIDNGFILYDEEKVYYREMTSYEYEQINNSEKSPMGSRLDMDGFLDVEKIIDDEYLNTHKINNEVYIVDYFDNYKIYLMEDYLKKEEFVEVDNLIFSSGFLYDKLNKNIIYYEGETRFGSITYKKIGDLYIFSAHSSACPCNESIIYDIEKNNILFLINNNVYITENEVYYIKNSAAYVVNSEGKKSLLVNDDIKPLYIVDGKFIYLDYNNDLFVKNVLTGEIYDIDSNVKNELYLLDDLENGIILFDIDESVINEKEFDDFRKNQNISDEQLLNIKKCINNTQDCRRNFELGHKIMLDKDGKFVSKDYYIQVYND